MKKCPICQKEINPSEFRIHAIFEELAIETIKEIFPQLANRIDICLRYYRRHQTHARNVTAKH